MQLVSGALAVVVLVGGSVALRTGDDDDEEGVVAEGGTTTTTATTLPNETTSTTDGSSGADSLETIVVPGAWPTEPVFAGVTLAGDVVLADPASGEVLLTLLSAQPSAPAVDVTLSNTKDAVYVGTYFDHRGGPLLRLRPGEPVDVLGSANVVAISPDGARLATTRRRGRQHR